MCEPLAALADAAIVMEKVVTVLALTSSLVSPPPPRREDWARVRLLYHPLPRSLAVGIVLALGTVWMLREGPPLDYLGVWLGIVVAVSIARWALLIAFQRIRTHRLSASGWENLFACGAAAAGGAWAALPLAGPLSHEQTLYVIFILGGMSLGSAGLHGASWRSFLAFNVPLVIAQAVALVGLDGRLHYAMGLMALLYGVVLVIAFTEFRSALLQSLSSNRENEQLNRRLRLIFETVSAGVAYTRDRQIVDCNQQMADMLGYLREEMIGQSTRFYYENHDTWEMIGSESADALARGQSYRCEVQLRAKSGLLVECDIAMESVMPRDPSRGVVVVANDISVRKAQERQLRSALLRQTAIFDHAPVGIFLTQNRVIEDCNEMAVKLFGYSREEWIGGTARRLFESDDAYARRGQETYALFARGEQHNYEQQLIRKNGERIWCRVRGGPIDPEGRPEDKAIFTVVDISLRKRAEDAVKQSREHLAQVIRASQSGIWDYDVLNDEAVFSARFMEILGYPATLDPHVIMPITRHICRHDLRRVATLYREHLAGMLPFNVDFRLRRSDRSFVWVRGYAQATWDEQGRPVRFVGSLLDISENKRQEAEIERMALRDPLTGLPNRRLLEDRLHFALAAARRRQTKVVVMMIDLDGFKSVNDHFGHAAGDLVLQEVGMRLEGALRESDTVSRIGGDEFVVVLEGAIEREDIATVAEKLMARLKVPVVAGDYSFHIGCSIGVACFPADGESPERLIRQADQAMYSVKHTGRNGYALFSELDTGDAENDLPFIDASPVFMRA